MSSVAQTTSETQAQALLRRMQFEHFMILNGCHMCGKTAKAMMVKDDKGKWVETSAATTLYKCHHGFKVCEVCKGKDILAPHWSKKQRRAFKKEKHNSMKALRADRLLATVS